MIAEVASVVILGFACLVLGFLCEYASPETVKSFVLGAVILNVIVIFSIMVYLSLK